MIAQRWRVAVLGLIMACSAGAAETSGVLEFRGTKTEIGGTLYAGNMMLGVMAAHGVKGSRLSVTIAPGSYVLKLKQQGAVQWSSDMVIEAGMEYFVDVSPRAAPGQRRPAEQAAVNPREVNWVFTPEQGLARARQQNKPVMMDFYTDWCGYCKKLDQEVYTDAKIIALSQKFVSVKVNADNFSALASQYGVNGYPTIVFLNPAGREISRIRGFCASGRFSQEMEKASQK